MIPFDFDYYKPTKIEEALQIYENVKSQNKKPMYYSGGTEFITFARINKVYADAVIDLKGIPDCHALEEHDDQLIIGSAVSLNKIADSNVFPLLGRKVKDIADHTSRNKITIGGNINSQLIYKEGILPLLLSEAKVKVAGKGGVQVLPLNEMFNMNLQLEQEQFIIQILIEKSYTEYPFFTLKKTKFSQVGYPVVSIAAIIKDNQIRLAFSGVCHYPFRSERMEKVLNDPSLTLTERVEQALSGLPDTIINDIQASAEYREFVLKSALLETLETLELKK
ncbi:FAD binding domain-containing protein [Lederbergia wuyishanensis]|uniref:CO/xanthine dehydrogenase FAD-binding subunit n=1 Tax=Lederbergia wuyishanensis TaxID=1347903 RepID=A0ABU0DA90_9BACI|nr:FAD binding domain-containing protein [Lederbergia wuyishanensis]MCJ8010110.1 FAD binding domain-containing protein [Lederbergia wuyishanensis]MDQ0345348.1 CO/xanthine dehydrogenase FAD-binding subunit [Lederbergia wuyishanensis]